MRRVIEASFSDARDAVDLDTLESVLNVGHPGTGAATYLLEDVIQQVTDALLGGESIEALRAAEEGGLPTAFSSALQAGAGATELCVVSNEPVLKAKKITATQSQIKSIWDAHLAGDSVKTISAFSGFTQEQVKWVIYKIKNQIPQLMKVLGPYAPPKVPKIPKPPKAVTTPVTPPSVVTAPGAVQGVVPPTIPAGSWPIRDTVERKMGARYPTTVEAHSFKPWRSQLTNAEQRAIVEYTGSEYQTINGYLRNKLEPQFYGHETISQASEKAQLIQSALNKANRPPPPELVWRGSRGGKEWASKLAKDDVIRLDGFQSTSINPGFAANWGESGAVFEIKPARGAYIQPMSNHPSEYEYLLPHGAQYRVVGTSRVRMQDRRGGYTFDRTVIQLEMLP